MNPEQVTDEMWQMGSIEEVQETEFVNQYMGDREEDYLQYVDTRNATFIIRT